MKEVNEGGIERDSAVFRALQFIKEFTACVVPIEKIQTLSDIARARKAIRNMCYGLVAVERDGLALGDDITDLVLRMVDTVNSYIDALPKTPEIEEGEELAALKNSDNMIDAEKLYNFLEPADTYEEWEAWQNKMSPEDTLH